MRLSRTGSVVFRAAFAAAGFAWGVCAFAGARAADPAPGLTVAILDLAQAPDLVPPPVEVRRSSWRTSFGSERQSVPAPAPLVVAPLPQLADADVVLIQGARAAAPLRRLFPPKAWRLVVSRRIVGSGDGGTEAGTAPAFATAIAIRANPDIRVTAREPGLRLVPPTAEPLSDALVSATAVRVAAAGRVIWLASVGLPADCSADHPCASAKDLDRWRTSKRELGATTLVGGRLAAAAAARSGAGRCALHGIDSDLETKPQTVADDGSGGGAPGCISIVRLAGVARSSSAAAADVAKSPTAP